MKKDLENAQAEYLATIRLDPNRAAAFNNLGSIFLQQGKISQAIVQFNEALRLKPDDAGAAQNLRIAQARNPHF